MLYIKRFFNFTTILCFLFSGVIFANQDNGGKIFKSVCMACHTIGKGRLVGPDLKNVDKKRSDIWLRNFIKSSSTMIKNGNKEAIAIFNEYNKMPMPDHNYTSDQLFELISYIKDQSSLTILKQKKVNSSKQTFSKVNKVASPIVLNVTKNDIDLGRNLFTGKKRFENNGIACISCHNVNVPNLISGGSLAVDLTKAYSRIGSAGLFSIIKSSPFPAMNRAYYGKNLNEDEVFVLQAFLQNVNDNYSDENSTGYIHKMLAVGFIGMLLLLGLFSIIWSGRKNECVNQNIYDRQIKSE